MHKYTRVKVLGKGGFGEAVLVEDKSTKKKYVIKEVRDAGAVSCMSAEEKQPVLPRVFWTLPCVI